MRPIDVCTPKPFQLEHSCFVVSQRGWPTRALPCGIARGPPSFPTTLRSPCSFRRMSLSRTVITRPRTSAHVHREARGHPMRTRLGRAPFHDEALTSASGRRSREAFLPLEESDSVRLWHPCRLLRPACLGPRFIGHQALFRRPPRPVSREPRERRALHRPRIPSTGSRSARPARAKTRTNPRSPRRE